MDGFNQWTRRLFLAGVVIWLLLAIFDVLSLGGLYAFLGALVVFLGLKNIGLLWLGKQSGHLPDKLHAFTDRYGGQKGLAIYLTLFVALYAVIGGLLLFSGVKVGL